MAEDDDFKLPAEFTETPEGLRIGMEIELGERHFANIAQYFDFAELEERYEGANKTLPTDFYDGYLENNPKAIEDIPEKLRAELEKGLRLEKTVIEERAKLIPPKAPEKITPQALIIPIQESPKPLTGGQGLILPNTKPETTPADFQQIDNFTQRDNLIVPKNSDWLELQKRWKNLPFEVKAKATNWEFLSPRKKAYLAITVAKGDINIKQKLPLKIREFFERFEWELDGSTIEFRHDETMPLKNVQQFLNDVDFLATKAGVRQQIFKPGKIVKDGMSFHYHLSIEGKDYEQIDPLTKKHNIAEKLNVYKMLKRIDDDILADLTGGKYTYHSDVKVRGLMSTHGKDRIEHRAHHEDLLDELSFNIKVQSMPEGEAHNFLDSEIKKILTDENLETILKHNMKFLNEIHVYLSEDKSFQIGEKVLAKKKLLEDIFGIEKNSKKSWREIVRIITENDVFMTNLILHELINEKKLPKAVWDLMPRLVNHDSDLVSRAAINLIKSQTSWPKSFWQALPELIIHYRTLHGSHGVLKALATRSSWPTHFWDSYIEIAKNVDPFFQRVLFSEGLTHLDKWDPRAWDLISNGLKSKDFISFLNVSNILVKRKTLTPEIWSEIIYQLENGIETKRQNLSSFLTRRSDIPKAVWDKVPDFLNSSSYALLSSAVTMLENQKWPESFWKEVPGLLGEGEPDGKPNHDILEALFQKKNLPPNVALIIQKLTNHPDDMIRNDAIQIAKLNNLENCARLFKLTGDID